MKNVVIINTLKSIMEASGGVLMPSSVVEHARDEDSPLHDLFEWDDFEAAEKYRLHQARQLIRVCVTIEPTTKNEVRMFVNLLPSRYDGGGYIDTLAALKSEPTRALVLETALSELQAFEKKYNDLIELAPVFAAADQVKSKRRKRVTANA